MDKRMAELVKFSQSFKLNKPIPDDLVPILAKDEDKQRQIKEKSTKDASSSQARNIGPSTSHAVPARGPQLTTAKIVEARKPSATPASNTAAQKSISTTSKTETAKPSKPVMFIQAIPPFKGSKSKPAAPSANGAAAPTPASSQSPAKSPTPSTGAANANAAARLNVNASSFRPNPKANAFTP
ncbi:hypothetical protein MPER_15168, partial [Moniliophthora perniciosa FA553]